jgi:hypothetical protein
MTIKIIADPLSGLMKSCTNHKQATSAHREFPILPDAQGDNGNAGIYILWGRARSTQGLSGDTRWSGHITSRALRNFRPAGRFSAPKSASRMLISLHYARCERFLETPSYFLDGYIRRYINCDGYLPRGAHI